MAKVGLVDGEQVIPDIATVSGIVHQARKVRKALQAAAEEAGEDPAKWARASQLHRLRRRFASQLADHGVPIPKVQLWMGHASIVTTQGYLTVDPTAPAGAGRALERKRTARVRELDSRLHPTAGRRA